MNQLKIPQTLSYSIFQWGLVAVQRKILMGVDISDEDLGSYIFQYSQQLKANHDAGLSRAGPFAYNPALKAQYCGADITLHRLSALITMWPTAQPYVRNWEDAMDAFINFQLKPTDAKKKLFKEKMEAASTVPR